MGGFEPMSEGVASTIRRNAFRFALTGIVGIWLSGCADATRFADSSNPFSNPFASGSASDDSLAPTPRVASRPLASARPNGNYATAARPSPTAVASAPIPAPYSTGAIQSRPEPVGGSAAGWSAVGGSPVVVGQNDDAATLSARYGVPEAALLSANGLRSRGELRPNMRIVIPVYNARGADARVAKADDDVKPRHAKRDDDERKPEAERKKAKAEAKSDDDDDAPKAKHGEAETKKHKSAKKDEDADAGDKPEKAAKAEKSEKLARADKAKEKLAEAAPKSEKAAKSEKAPDVAKAEPAKLPKKEDTDKRATGDLASTSADGGDDASKFRWPARGRIIQGFKSGGNDGINIALPEGTSVRAAEDGKVAYAGSALKGYGNLVLIRHPNGFVTAYANNGELDVKSGDSVKRGQVIAKSGQTGDVSSPQLHFELRRGQTPVDPTNYLAGL